MTSDDRGRGVLSGSDREYLQNPDSDEFTRQARYKRRNAIPERVWNGFLDGRVLYNQLSAEQRREIFAGWRDFADSVEADADEQLLSDASDVAQSRGEWLEKIAAERGFAGWFAFLYLGLTESDEFSFSDVIETAVTRAERSRGREVSTFELAIETESQPSVDELRARFDEREELTVNEIKRLREADEIADADLVEYYDEFTEHTTDKV